MRTRRLSKAFTLVEILIVVVILGILAAIVVPQFTNATQDAQVGNLRAQIKSIQNQLELYRARNNAYPTLAQLTADSANADYAGMGWGVMIDGNYLKAPAKNPYNGSSVIAAEPTDGNGWHYDETTGAIGACYYDESTETMTPGTP